MPIFNFYGATEKRVHDYFKNIGEIAQLVNVDVEHFVFWKNEAKLIGNGYEKDSIYVVIDWIGRPLKQEAVSQHIVNFFKNDSKHIYVKFNEINSFLYLNGESIS